MDISRAIKKGLRFLKRTQKKDGSFSTYNFPENNTAKKTAINTTFITANIVHALAPLQKDPTVKEILNKATKFLLRQKAKHLATINYWPRGSKESNLYFIPDDLDCTVVTYAALHEIGLYTGEETIKVMMGLEEKSGGPYTTWIVGAKNKDWKSKELGVNANVLWYALLNDIYLPNILEYIYEELKSGVRKTSYYPEYTLCYLISRAIKDGKLEVIEAAREKSEKIRDWSKEIRNIIKVNAKKRLRNKQYDSDMEFVSLVYSLLSLNDSDISDYVRILLRRQDSKGSWQLGGFNFGHNSIHANSSDGSEALTTAIAIEVLQKYSLKKANPENFIHPEFQKEYKEVEKSYKLWEKKQPQKLQPLLAQISSKILKETFTIRSALLPFFYYNSLSVTKQKMLNKSLLTTLGANNIIGWIGYYLEDKILDEHIKTKNIHELAALCKNEFLRTISFKLNENKEFLTWINNSEKTYVKTLNWELSNTRFKSKLPTKLPDYKNYKVLADRSLPFIYSTALLATKLNYQPSSTIFKSLVKMLHHHLITKQLNDDARDLEEDLQSGRISSVLSLALKSGGTPKKLLSEKLLKTIVKLTLKHLKLSERFANQAQLKHPEVFLHINEGLLDNSKKLEHELRILNVIS